MPFTFSHPALVLPLALLGRRWCSLTGLVVGSVAPDFEYFLRFDYYSAISHTLFGLFFFDLPLGLLLAFLFHGVVREPLFANLPGFLRGRVQAYRGFDWPAHFRAHWVVVLVSILLGALSHVLWDAATHDHGFFVERIPFLTAAFEVTGKEWIPVRLLERSSSILGLGVIAAVFFTRPATPVAGRVYLRYWVVVAAITVLLSALRLGFGAPLKQLEQLVTIVMASGIAGLLFAPTLLASFGTIRKQRDQ